MIIPGPARLPLLTVQAALAGFSQVAQGFAEVIEGGPELASGGVEGRSVCENLGQYRGSVSRMVLDQSASQAHTVIEQGAHLLREQMGTVLPVDSGADW